MSALCLEPSPPQNDTHCTLARPSVASCPETKIRPWWLHGSCADRRWLEASGNNAWHASGLVSPHKSTIRRRAGARGQTRPATPPLATCMHELQAALAQGDATARGPCTAAVLSLRFAPVHGNTVPDTPHAAAHRWTADYCRRPCPTLFSCRSASQNPLQVACNSTLSIFLLSCLHVLQNTSCKVIHSFALARPSLPKYLLYTYLSTLSSTVMVSIVAQENRPFVLVQPL